MALEDSLIYHLAGDAFEAARRQEPDFDTLFIRALSDRLTMQAAPQTFRGVSGETVCSLITRAPVSIGIDATVRDVAERMVAERVSAMLVSTDGELGGIVTDRDIRTRVVAAGLSSDHPVTDIMTCNPISLDGDAHAYEAAMVMMQNNIHHLPVTSDGKLIGMVSRSDFMRIETEHPLYLVSDIGKQTTAAGVVAACERLPALIIGQIESDASGEQLGKFITMITDTVTRQLLKIAESELGAAAVRVRLGRAGLAGAIRAIGQERPGQCAAALEPGDGCR